MTVFLIGFMGSGKSTLGRRMASRSGWRFEDLDTLIEQFEGRTVEEIFRESGEDYFRKVEAETLRRIKPEENIIIACGGGTPCFKDNMKYMNSSGVTIYLKHEVRTLANRLRNARKIRPLLKGMDEDSMVEYISVKLAEREQFYSKAKLIIDGMKADPGRMMEIIQSVPPYNHEGYQY